MNKKLLILVIIGILIVLLGSIFLLNSKSDRDKNTTEVEKKRYIKSVYASGYIDSSNKVVIKPEVSGYIESIYVTDGELVTKGQPLALISNKKLREELKEIEALKSLIISRLKKDSDYLKMLKDEVEIQRLNLDIEKKNYDRRKSLLEKGIISKESYDRSEISFEVAEKNYKKSIETLNDKMSELNSDLDSLAAREQSIKEEINKHYIKSPVNGEVLRKMVEQGDYVNSLVKDNELFSVGDTKKLETVLLVDEEYIPLIKIGQLVHITTDAFPGEAFEGNVILIEKEADRTTRTVIVKADVQYPENTPVGITVEANIVIEDRESLFISKEAYRDGHVETIKDGENVKVPVETGIKKDGLIEVKEGATENQKVLNH
ncbi:MAG: permease [Thermodesulfobacteriota bacterium]|nr:MAG: permease [Thermodesulfobacteriota bacterium]